MLALKRVSCSKRGYQLLRVNIWLDSGLEPDKIKLILVWRR